MKSHTPSGELSHPRRSKRKADDSDYDLALKFFLRATEMETDPEHLELYKTNSRTWWGVKLVRLRPVRSMSS